MLEDFASPETLAAIPKENFAALPAWRLRGIAGVGYFAMHSTSASKVGLGTQLSSFLGAASATGFGAVTDASGCPEAC